MRGTSRPPADVFAIVGSGFGLYGYLPAVVEALGERVLLPEAYRAKVAARPELHPYLSSIQWVADLQAALGSATAVVIATPPARQLEVATQCLGLPAIHTLVLEKPLACSPQEAQALLAGVRSSGKRYRVGYTFLHCDWAMHLPREWAIGQKRDISIGWTFMAHHFARELSNWKRVHAQGGGALRFFGVHLIALLASQGYREVRESTLHGAVAGEPERWQAVFHGSGLPACHVSVDTRSPDPMFRISAGEVLVDLADPYAAEPASGEADRRVGVLERFLDSLQDADAGHDAFCDEVNRLWQRTEDATRLAAA